MTYTKGEWRVHELDRDANSCPPPLAELIPSPPKTKIQVVSFNAFNKIDASNEDYEESRANAHLIASAPDMYEALKAIIERVDKGLALGEKLDIKPARKALSKAEVKYDTQVIEKDD